MHGTLSRRRMPRRRAPVVWLLLATSLVAPTSVLAARAWTVVASPDELTVDEATAVRLTVTNTSSSGSGMQCVLVTVPSDFDISSVAVVSVNGQSGGSLLGWSAAWLGGSDVAFKTTLGLGALGEGDDAIFRVTGTATSPGPMRWTAIAYDTPGLPLTPSCGSNAYPTATLDFTVLPGPTPIPTATPTPTPPPTPRPTPTPTLLPLPTLPPPTFPPLPTLPPLLPTPTLPLPPLPTLGTPGPSGAPAASTGPSPEPTAGPQSTAVAPSQSGGAGEPASSPPLGGGLAGPEQPLALQVPGGRGARAAITGLGDVVVGALIGSPGGLLEWAFPAVALSIPGLLLLLAVAAQAIGALAWLPLIRRRIGGFGLRPERGHRGA
jgi:hypothetical protein